MRLSVGILFALLLSVMDCMGETWLRQSVCWPGTAVERPSAMEDHEEKLSLRQAAIFLLEECRTILPGIQALFGFQLIAIFNDGFDTKLSSSEQDLHLAAISLVAVAVVLIMAPAAYHRQTGPMKVNARFITVASRAALLAMIALMLGLTLDFYVVAQVVLGERKWSLLLAALLCGLIVTVWFMLPRTRALRRYASAGDHLHEPAKDQRGASTHHRD
ncbi:MAG TPA: DUF6328 family protein [Burkholderiales bacterium]|nr:DUF6328 family protein [Burkholderiales bacterium]